MTIDQMTKKKICHPKNFNHQLGQPKLFSHLLVARLGDKIISVI
jgi:hypothetical protein